MRKGLIFYVLCGFCALGTLTSCSNATQNDKTQEEENIVTDYSNIHDLIDAIKTYGTDIEGKTVTIAYDDIDKPIGNIGLFYMGEDMLWSFSILDYPNSGLKPLKSGESFKAVVYHIHLPDPAIVEYQITLSSIEYYNKHFK